MEKFSQLLTDFEHTFSQILEKKLFSISFFDLKKMNRIKSMLEEMKFLPDVYDSNGKTKRLSSLKKKTISPEAILNETQGIFIDILERFQKLDNLRLNITNIELSKENVNVFFQFLADLIFKFYNFALAYQDEKNSYSFSSINEFKLQISKETFNTISSFFSKNQIKGSYHCKKLVESIVKDAGISQETKEDINKMFENSDVYIISIPWNENSHLIAIFQENSKELFENLFKIRENESFAINIIVKIFRAITSTNKSEIISKNHVCQIIDKFKYFLILEAETLCKYQIRSILKEKFKLEMYIFFKKPLCKKELRGIISEEEPQFLELQNSIKNLDDLIILEQEIAFPIKFFEKIQFFMKIKNVGFDILSFKTKFQELYNNFYHKCVLIKENNIFFQILTNHCSDFVLVFNQENNLIFQNKEIPNNLKYLFKNKTKNLIELNKSEKPSEIFFENSKFFQKFDLELINLKKGIKYFESFRFKPSFDLILNKRAGNITENIILMLHNEKDLVVETKEYDTITTSVSSLTKKNKLEKYWSIIFASFQLKNEISLEEASKLLRKHEQEISNPIQSVLDENKNTRKEDLIFLKEYVAQGANLWTQIISPKKKKNSQQLTMSKISIALFNSITRQPKEKLYEMPNLIEQISIEVDNDKNNNNNDNAAQKNDTFSQFKDNLDFINSSPLFVNTKAKDLNFIPQEKSFKLKHVKSFGLNMTMKNTTEEIIPAKVDFRFDNDSLEKLNDWEFSILTINDNMQKYNLIWMMFHTLGFFEKYEIDIDIFGRFLSIIKEKYNYRTNPFHNFDHGFTVAHTIYVMIFQKLFSEYLDYSDFFCLLLAGLCHDVDHTARTNVFEVASHSRLAIKYNDESVLENNHASVTFKILCDKNFNILENVSELTFNSMRKAIISNILHTDMKKHFVLIKDFEFQSKDIKSNPQENLMKNQANKTLFTGLIIHGCDLYSSTKKFAIAKEWSYKINAEFTHQIQDEEKLGLPVTPYMRDLDKPAVLAKAEIGFIKFVQRPIWNVLNIFFDNKMAFVMSNIDQNIKKWESILEENLIK